jgi:hypothetical protein
VTYREADIVAKYVEQLVRAGVPSPYVIAAVERA